jgi:putative FmdB family regulatory protein
MPIYTYRCQDCQHEFDELIMSASAEKDLRCPQCGCQSVERRMAAFATGKSSTGPIGSCGGGGG